MKFVIVADFFLDDIVGGGELNNEELIRRLLFNGHDVHKIRSHKVDTKFIDSSSNLNYIISNFWNLSDNSKKALQNKKVKYIIYEHDHKYLPNRDPAAYKDFIAPKDKIINYQFYKNAIATLCQSSFHKGIVERNLELDNIISLGGNIWSDESLDKLSDFCSRPKAASYAIMDSQISHKNTQGAVLYCKKNNLPYELIPPCGYYDFLERLSKHESFVFFPQTPETLSRVVVEARMMGMRIVTNNLVGASQEEWFKLKGHDLISEIRKKKSDITDTVMNLFTPEDNKITGV